MKHLILLLLLAGIGVFTSCKKDISHYRLRVDVHEDFEQDKVQVFFDGKEKLNKQLQTNHVLGLAFPGAVNERVKKGKHTLKVIVNDSISHQETFTLKAYLYIGVSYNRQAQTISFGYSNIPFAYD